MAGLSVAVTTYSGSIPIGRLSMASIRNPSVVPSSSWRGTFFIGAVSIGTEGLMIGLVLELRE